MRRTVARLVMLVVGLGALAAYALASALTYWVLSVVWTSRPSALTTVLVLLAVTLATGYLTYRTGSKRLLADLRTRQLRPADAPGLFARLDDLCARAGVERPPLYVADLGEPNAFAVGDLESGAVVLDDSLFALLSADELTGVLAHELGHLKARDSLVQVLSLTAVGTAVELLTLALLPAVLLATGVAKAWAWARGTPGAWSRTLPGRLRTLALSLVLLVPTVVSLAALARSRRREFAADDFASDLTGDPAALARALRKIEDATRVHLALRGVLIGSDDTHPMLRLLATHPALEDRVARLATRAEGGG
jgi:heat shock protein HtpX